MKIRYIQTGWILLLVVLVLGLAVTPAGASSRTTQQRAQRLNSTPINATIYLTTATLAPIFQSRINQRVPADFNNALMSMVSKLPKADQAWALQMATALLQPSASLTSLIPQQGGLAGTITLSLYPGDPKATTSTMLFSFSVADSSTVQVSAQPLSGPALVTGDVSTFQIPVGQINHVATTPGCGNAALAVNLQFPVTLGQLSAQGQQVGLGRSAQPLIATTKRFPTNTDSSTDSYVEIPASSLASLGSSVGSLPVSNNLTAQNIRLGVQGSDLLINSDIYSGNFFLGTAVTTAAPTASGGNIAVHVLSTTLTIFIFTFPYNSYNQQIEQTINKKLNGALAGKFYVNQAAIGANSHVTCAAKNSLILTGTASFA